MLQVNEHLVCNIPASGLIYKDKHSPSILFDLPFQPIVAGTTALRSLDITRATITMRLVLPYLLCLAWLANGAVIPYQSNTTTAELEARNSVNGYRSVAYFVNWVRASQLLHSPQLKTMSDEPRLSTAATIFPNSFLLRD